VEVSVYYRGAMGKLHAFRVEQVEAPADAILVVKEETQGDLFAKGPFLALIQGGKK